MKLDRNINSDGSGKYALLKLRKLREITAMDSQLHPDAKSLIDHAVRTLKHHKVLHFGDEGPGEQFFVMKYKDVFTAQGLEGYAKAVIASKTNVPGLREELLEYADEILNEAATAEKVASHVPD